MRSACLPQPLFSFSDVDMFTETDIFTVALPLSYKSPKTPDGDRTRAYCLLLTDDLRPTSRF